MIKFKGNNFGGFGTLHTYCEHIESWEDFEYGTLSIAYDDILVQKANPPNPSKEWEFTDSAELKTILLEDFKRLQGVIDQSHNVIKNRLENCPRDKVGFRKTYTMTPGTPAPLSMVALDGNTATSVRLTGVCRPSQVWKSTQLSSKTDNDLLPMRQLYKTAKENGTPYGFIATDVEIVVVRFSPHRTVPGGFNAQWKSVKWEVQGEGILTAYMALWGLAMMSLIDQFKQLLEEEKEMPELHAYVGGLLPPEPIIPLNTWEIVKNIEGKEVYMHCFSRKTQHTKPFGDRLLRAGYLDRKGDYRVPLPQNLHRVGREEREQGSSSRVQ